MIDYVGQTVRGEGFIVKPFMPRSVGSEVKAVVYDSGEKRLDLADGTDLYTEFPEDADAAINDLKDTVKHGNGLSNKASEILELMGYQSRSSLRYEGTKIAQSYSTNVQRRVNKLDPYNDYNDFLEYCRLHGADVRRSTDGHFIRLGENTTSSHPLHGNRTDN